MFACAAVVSRLWGGAQQIGADPNGADGNADFQRKGGEAGDEEGDGEDEKRGDKLIGMKQRDGIDEEGGDQDADGEGGGDGEADGAVGEQHAAIEDGEISDGHGALLWIIGNGGFQQAGAIDDAAKAGGHHGKEGADCGEQEDRRDGELDGAGEGGGGEGIHGKWLEPTAGLRNTYLRMILHDFA